jgi:hypothetical protein
MLLTTLSSPLSRRAGGRCRNSRHLAAGGGSSSYRTFGRRCGGRGRLGSGGSSALVLRVSSSGVVLASSWSYNRIIPSIRKHHKTIRL